MTNILYLAITQLEDHVGVFFYHGVMGSHDDGNAFFYHNIAEKGQDLAAGA